MQDIKFSATLVWSIVRDNEGPYKAYKNLGQDLCNATPNEANNSLCSKARDKFKQVLANMEISEVLKNREKLRDRIRKEMQQEVAGWGVWIETVELEDITIMDNALFKNMQAHFREETNQTAQLTTMRIKNENTDVQRKYAMELKAFKDDLNERETAHKQRVRVETQQLLFKEEEEIAKYRLEEQALTKQADLQRSSLTAENDNQIKKDREAIMDLQNANKDKAEVLNQKDWEAGQKYSALEKDAELVKERAVKEHEMSKGVLEASFVRENKSGDVVKHNAYQVVKQALNYKNVQMHTSNGSGAAANDDQMANLAKSVAGQKKK